MIRKILTILFLMVQLCAKAWQGDPNLGIIPAPKSIRINQVNFYFNTDLRIVYQTPQEYKIAHLLIDLIKEKFALHVTLVKKISETGKHTIRFITNHNATSNESYQLTISPDLITISGKEAGLF